MSDRSIDELALERHKFSDGRSCASCGSDDIDTNGLQLEKIEGALAVTRRVNCNICGESYVEHYGLEYII
jgi:hypothetical protein